jgi:hypothetical protein
MLTRGRCHPLRSKPQPTSPFGKAAGFKSVRWPLSNRNRGRLQIGTVAGIKSEKVAAFSWNLHVSVCDLRRDRPLDHRGRSDARYDKHNVVLRREDAPGASLTCRYRTLPGTAQAPTGRSLGTFWLRHRWGNDFRSAGNCDLPAFGTLPYSLRRFATELRVRPKMN